MASIRPSLLASLFLWLLASNAQAQAYERARIDGLLLCRPSRTFTYAVATSPGHPTPEERAAIQAAVNTWRQAASSCSDLVFEQTADVTDGTLTFGDGRALIIIRPRLCRDVVPEGQVCNPHEPCVDEYGCWAFGSDEVVNASATFRYTTGEIVGAHIALNSSNGTLSTVDSPPCAPGTHAPDCVSGDVQSLMTRSIGEALGFALVDRLDSTMARRLDWGDTQKRVIDPGTLQGLCELYPRGQPTPGCAIQSPPDAGTPGGTDGGVNPPKEEEPAPSKGGCGAAPTVPLLGALVLWLAARRRR
ncbi:MYXO-CTERM-anchored inactivated metalloprotease [Hyalangium rubrum]|uniref:MYXO-CTERM-anchored inactivated metalloprotease n=1 Tax=Hyalangium rubrum TaxID=3103134 RepID=A0ABU5HGJ6_9BACT|nr:MYXO-CTERM-anchored inactivated metalloprotease [Hyalangium sp. s54d21]MDY7232578.1 MYXO-CTERM-anchored inactivated metalloprotease [Hyalangium sp. s54d21]